MILDNPWVQVASLDGRLVWDGEGADDEVGHRQGEEEVVGDCLQLFVYLERYHYLNNKDCFKIPEHKQT